MRPSKILLVFTLFLAIFSMAITSLFALQAGEEFQVNTHTKREQNLPCVAMDEKGNFVVAWSSRNQDGSGYGVFAQRYDQYGKPAGEEFQVNTYFKGRQEAPSIAMNRKGNFVATWTCFGQDGSNYGIFAQRYNGKGETLGNEFQVNTYTEMFQMNSCITMNERGNFVAVWSSSDQDGSGYGVFAQRFNKNGTTLGPEFQVNTYTMQNQESPCVAMNKKGNFVIAWISYEQDGSGRGVFAQRYDKSGMPVGPEFQVNTYAYEHQSNPCIAMDRKGNFVVAWISWKQNFSQYGVYAQRFKKNGEPVGPEFQVNTYTIGIKNWPAIAMNRKGNFVITWTSWAQDGSDHGVFAQRFNKNGKTVGPEFQVNNHIDKNQARPCVAMDKKGNFIIAWESLEQDGSGTGIFAKLFKNLE